MGKSVTASSSFRFRFRSSLHRPAPPPRRSPSEKFKPESVRPCVGLVASWNDDDDVDDMMVGGGGGGGRFQICICISDICRVLSGERENVEYST